VMMVPLCLLQTVLVLEYLKLGNVQLWLERTRYE